MEECVLDALNELVLTYERLSSQPSDFVTVSDWDDGYEYGESNAYREAAKMLRATLAKFSN